MTYKKRGKIITILIFIVVIFLNGCTEISQNETSAEIECKESTTNKITEGYLLCLVGNEENNGYVYCYSGYDPASGPIPCTPEGINQRISGSSEVLLSEEGTWTTGVPDPTLANIGGSCEANEDCNSKLCGPNDKCIFNENIDIFLNNLNEMVNDEIYYFEMKTKGAMIISNSLGLLLFKNIPNTIANKGTLISEYGNNVMIHCFDKTMGLLIEFKDEEESPTSELYACVGVQGNKAIISEEEVDAESTIIYRWLDEDEMGKIKYDKDQDKVPFFADCNEESDQVYGMFAPYFVGTGAKVPTVVCGDGIPNTCGSHEFFFEGEPEQDECDNNKVSCLNDCLRKENKCGWIDDEDGKCCGDDGLEDIGILSEGDGESHICLNKDNVFVSPSPPSDLCENDFCWVEATLLPGKIFTIKKPDEIYDVASDGASWRNCEDNVNLFSSDQAEHITQANRLSCYSEGNRYVWAQCFKKGSEESVSDDSKNGIKNRFIGDGLFSLPLPEPSEGNSVEISIEEEYETFYGSLPVDFIGYDKIHVFFTFKELEDFPAKLDMGFYSGGFNLENLIFKKNIIGYATNNPVLEEGRTIHLEINIPNNLIGIDNLKFKTNGDNEIILNNVYFSIGEEIPKICSGEESNTKQVSSWLDNYGQDGDVSAENVCNALFDPFSVENEDGNFPGNAWIKNAENEGDRCCGDQKNEYYTGEAIEG